MRQRDEITRDRIKVRDIMAMMPEVNDDRMVTVAVEVIVCA